MTDSSTINLTIIPMLWLKTLEGISQTNQFILETTLYLNSFPFRCFAVKKTKEEIKLAFFQYKGRRDNKNWMYWSSFLREMYCFKIIVLYKKVFVCAYCRIWLSSRFNLENEREITSKETTMVYVSFLLTMLLYI